MTTRLSMFFDPEYNLEVRSWAALEQAKHHWQEALWQDWHDLDSKSQSFIALVMNDEQFFDMLNNPQYEFWEQQEQAKQVASIQAETESDGISIENEAPTVDVEDDLLNVDGLIDAINKEGFSEQDKLILSHLDCRLLATVVRDLGIDSEMLNSAPSLSFDSSSSLGAISEDSHAIESESTQKLTALLMCALGDGPYSQDKVNDVQATLFKADTLNWLKNFGQLTPDNSIDNPEQEEATRSMFSTPTLKPKMPGTE